MQTSDISFVAVYLLTIDVKKPLENRGEMEDKGITLSFETDMSLFFCFFVFLFFLLFQSQLDFSFYYFAVVLIFFRNSAANAVNFDK